MKPSRFSLPLMAALLLALTTIAAACAGGGDEPTLEEYFRQLEARVDERERQFDALQEEFTPDEEGAPDLSSGEVLQQIDAVRRFYEASGPIFGDFVEAVDGIDPPPEVENPHEEFVAAGAAVLDLFLDFTGRLADVESVVELGALFNDPGLDAASARYGQACSNLQGIADDNGIDVDLQCQEE